MMKKNLCDSCATDCGHYIEPGEFVVECGAYRPPITNADRIRAMSDEELARELALIAEWDRKQLQKAKSGPGLVEFMEHWLQQPAEDDT